MSDIIDMLEDELPLVGVSPWNVIMAVLVAVIGYAIIHSLVMPLLKKTMVKAKFGDILTDFVGQIIRILLLVFLVGTVLAILGLSIGPALISFSVVLGFVLGFAMGDTLSNIAAGFMLAITKPFKKGDYVNISGEEGVIQMVGISTTELDTPDNKHIVIPNKLAWGSNIINFTANPTRRVDMVVGVSYGSDLNKVIKVLMKVIKADGNILEDPAPFVAVKEMGDSSVDLVVRPWTKTENYWTVFFSCQKAIKEAFDSEGIEIPFPQMDVHLQKE